MQTFDQSLFQLLKDGLISERDALAVATKPEELRIALANAGIG
jgi:twitching motility protein PilT